MSETSSEVDQADRESMRAADQASVLRRFADDVRAAVDALAGWHGAHEEVAARHGCRRAELARRLLSTRQVRSALDWGPSVGVYGESQAGKSTLISAFGHAMTDEGGQKAGDSETQELEVQPHRGSRKVLLSNDLDPGKGGEATGIVCRFVRREPALGGAGEEREERLRV